MKFIDTRGLFDISNSVELEVNEVEGMGSIITLSNLYKNPTRIMDFFNSIPAPIWKNTPTTKNFIEYYDSRHNITLATKPLLGLFNLIIPLLEEGFGETFNTYPDLGNIVTNVFQDIDIPLEEVSAVPHMDQNTNLIIPLNMKEDGSSSTRFYTIDNGSEVVEEFLKSNNLYEDGDLYYNSEVGKYWKLFHEVPHIFNQGIIFAGQIPHGAWHKGFKKGPRVNQVVFLDTQEIKIDRQN
jgi:hypothetical protein